MFLRGREKNKRALKAGKKQRLRRHSLVSWFLHASCGLLLPVRAAPGSRPPACRHGLQPSAVLRCSQISAALESPVCLPTQDAEDSFFFSLFFRHAAFVRNPF